MSISSVNGTMDSTKKDIVILTNDINNLVSKLTAKLGQVNAIADRANVVAMITEINGYSDDQSEFYVTPLTSVHQFHIDDLGLVVAEFLALAAKTQATVDAYNA